MYPTVYPPRKLTIGLIGTACSGKTTMALKLGGRLREAGIRAEVSSSVDRTMTWPVSSYAADHLAHYGMLAAHILKETQLVLSPDTEVVIVDKTPLDLAAYCVVDHPNHLETEKFRLLCLDWMQRYSRLYYLPPLPHVDDGKRPDDDFRMKVHTALETLLRSCFIQVLRLDREDIPNDLLTFVSATA